MRAVVTEIRETSAAVLCEDGQIRLIPAQNFHKGQEITLSAGRRRIRRPLMWAACVAVLCAMATTSVYAVCEPYSSVTVDGEESVEYTLNRFDWVIGTRVSGEKPPKGESVRPSRTRGTPSGRRSSGSTRTDRKTSASRSPRTTAAGQRGCARCSRSPETGTGTMGRSARRCASGPHRPRAKRREICDAQ